MRSFVCTDSPTEKSTAPTRRRRVTWCAPRPRRGHRKRNYPGGSHRSGKKGFYDFRPLDRLGAAKHLRKGPGSGKQEQRGENSDRILSRRDLRGQGRLYRRRCRPSKPHGALRVEVPNPNRRLKPGMFATAEVVTGGASAKAIVIPSSAIQKIEGKPAAFVRQRMALSPRENWNSAKKWATESRSNPA